MNQCCDTVKQFLLIRWRVCWKDMKSDHESIETRRADSTLLVIYWMLLFLKNGTDISENVIAWSLKLVDQLNNRANTAKFVIHTTAVDTNDTIEIYEVLELTEQAASWQADIVVHDTFEEYDIFRAWDEIILDIEWTPTYATIDSIDHDAKTVTLTSNLWSTLAKSVVCWRKIFAWVVSRSPNVEISSTGDLERTVTVTDRKTAINRKDVVDSFEDMYLREIIWRAVYQFCANDTEEILETFESAWTESGAALAMANESTDRIVWVNSQKTWTSWAWTALRTTTISSVDISAMTDIRLWWKMADAVESDLTSLTVRVWNDASNYYERSSVFVWSWQDDCWNRDNFKLDRATETWSVTDAAIDRLQIEVVCSGAIAAGDILFDQMLATTWWFTLQNCIRWTRKFSDYRANYRKMSEVIDTLAKVSSLFWYIDYNRDIHVFWQNTQSAPIAITDSSENYWEFEVNPDVSQFRNRQTVRGGEAPASVAFTESRVADWEETSRQLSYKPKDLSVEVNSVAKTVWLENLVDESTVDFVYNFQEKFIRNANLATLSDWDVIDVTYYPYQSIRVRVQNPGSIWTMKALVGGDWIFDWPIIEDTSLLTYEDARRRALAELETYANPIISIRFKTDKAWLRSGQIISITDSSRWISDDYLIQRVQRRSLDWTAASYRIIECWSTMFWLVEFFQYLLRKSTSLNVDDSEILDIVINIDETITMTDVITPTNKSKTFVIAEMMSKKWFDFVGSDWSVSATWLIVWSTFGKQRYAAFSWSAVWVVGFDESSNYHQWKSLYIDVTTWGVSQYVLARMANMLQVKSSTEYNFAARVENLASWWLTGGDWLTIEVKEYADNLADSPLATNTIVADRNTVQDFDQITGTFTTNASTNYIDIVFTVNESTWKVSVGEIRIEETATETQTNPAMIWFSEVV